MHFNVTMEKSIRYTYICMFSDKEKLNKNIYQ